MIDAPELEFTAEDHACADSEMNAVWARLAL